MNIAVPALSLAGWVIEAPSKADLLMAHFYESDKAQSYLYGNNVTNLQWLIEQHSNDISALTQQIRVTLLAYLSSYFDDVNIDVTADDNDVNNLTGKVTITIRCNVVSEGKMYPFGKGFIISNSKIEKVLNLNNNGLL